MTISMCAYEIGKAGEMSLFARTSGRLTRRRGEEGPTMRTVLECGNQ